jgi:replicative DNA helicase
MTIPNSSLLTPNFIPPQDLNAEVAVLSAMMLGSEGLAVGLELLREEHFYRTAHRTIFKAMSDLFASGTEVDIITVINQLIQMGQLDKVGGKPFINDISDMVVSSANISHHAKIVLNKATERELLTYFQQGITMIQSADMSTADKCDSAETALFKITQSTMSKSFTHISQIVPSVIDEIKERAENKTGIIGIPTGFPLVDNTIGGFRPGQLIIIAARPGVGKSALAVNVAFDAANLHEKTVGIFTMEMANYEMIYRMLSSSAHVRLDFMMKGFIDENTISRVEQQGKVIMNKKIFIDDGSNTITKIKTKARRLKAEQKKLDLIIVDYLQLIIPSKSFANRNDEVAEICRNLKLLAKDLNIPIIALSQLSRESDKGNKPRDPRLSDLRDSGAIEQDADIVMFIHKEKITDSQVELIIAKNRNGPTEKHKLIFVKEYTLFKNPPTNDENAQYASNRNNWIHN